MNPCREFNDDWSDHSCPKCLPDGFPKTTKAKTRDWLELERIEPERYIPVKETKVHMFVKGENRVVCMPTRSMGNKVATTSPSKVTCKNCITKAVRKARYK